jgi:hypothetical protein
VYIKRHNRGKTHTIKSFILQSSHIMILNSTKFGGNQTKDVEVGPDRRTGRFLYTPPNYVCGGYNKGNYKCHDYYFLMSETVSLIFHLLWWNLTLYFKGSGDEYSWNTAYFTNFRWMHNNMMCAMNWAGGVFFLWRTLSYSQFLSLYLFVWVYCF